MEKKSPFYRLWLLLAADKQDVKSIYFYAIVSGLVQLTVPIGVQAIIGFVLGANMVTSIYILILLVVTGVLLVGIFQINQMRIIEKIQQSIFTRYAFEFTERIPRFDLQKVDNMYLPELINRFFDTQNLQKGLSKLLIDLPLATIQIVFGLVLLSLYHPFFIGFGLLLVTIIFFMLRMTANKGIETSFKESSYKYEVVAWLEEMARVIKSFKFTQGTNLNLLKTDANLVNYLKSRTLHFKILVFQYSMLVFFKVAVTASMLLLGTYLLINQQLNIGEFIAAEIVILTVISAVEKLIGNLDSVYDVVTSLEKLSSVTEGALESEGQHELNISKGIQIDLKDFEFSYSDGKKAISNLSVEIPANSSVCISGPEGAGKTTLLKILSGSYKDNKGTVLFNKIPLNNYRLESLRSSTGIYLSQQDLFIGTVWENITMGRHDIDADKIISIANKLSIENFLDFMPNGFETIIDPAGKRLSSSVAKKILLLRAMANSPKLLLLDEPWLGLDSNEKSKMINYLLKGNVNTTSIIVSNDSDFAKMCDYHIVMEIGSARVYKNKA